MTTQLVINVYPTQNCLSGEVLAALEKAMALLTPVFWHRAAVVLDEDDEERVSVASSLPVAVSQKVTTRGGIGQVIVIGLPETDPSVDIVGSIKTTPIESNRIAVEFETSEDGPVALSIALIRLLATLIPIRYAVGYTRDERHAKNLIRDQSGVRAVGVDFHKALPGLYWMNYFGRGCVNQIGRELLASAPAHGVDAVGEGLLLQLAARPSDWDTAEYRHTEIRVLTHIGPQFFFSKDDPTRATIAPIF
jgi:hypothetical protein